MMRALATVSCGVLQISGLSTFVMDVNRYNGYSAGGESRRRVLLSEFLDTWESRGNDRSYSIVCFSDNHILNNGEDIYNILNIYPRLGSCIKSPRTNNTNSKIDISCYLWTVSSEYALAYDRARFGPGGRYSSTRNTPGWVPVWKGFIEEERKC